MGITGLWSGYPFVWVNCLLILIVGAGGCGVYYDWFPSLLDSLFYAIVGYGLLLIYYKNREKPAGWRASNDSPLR